MQYIRKITITDSESVALDEAIERYIEFAKDKNEPPYIARLFHIERLRDKIRESLHKTFNNEL